MSSYEVLSLRSLQRALEISDGVAQLAAELRLAPCDLKSMLKGDSRVPPDIFLKVVDVLYPTTERRAQVRVHGMADQRGPFGITRIGSRR